MKRQGGGRFRPRGCAVVPASIMPRGFFASLPIDQGRFAGKRENRRNQSHSSRRPDSFPAQAPIPLHMAEFVPKCKGRHVAVQQKARTRKPRCHQMSSGHALALASTLVKPISAYSPSKSTKTELSSAIARILIICRTYSSRRRNSSFDTKEFIFTFASISWDDEGASETSVIHVYLNRRLPVEYPRIASNTEA